MIHLYKTKDPSNYYRKFRDVLSKSPQPQDYHNGGIYSAFFLSTDWEYQNIQILAYKLLSSTAFQLKIFERNIDFRNSFGNFLLFKILIFFSPSPFNSKTITSFPYLYFFLFLLSLRLTLFSFSFLSFFFSYIMSFFHQPYISRLYYGFNLFKFSIISYLNGQTYSCFKLLEK